MNKLITSLLLALSMNACVTNSSTINLDNADPEADALAALEKRDFRFMALTLRGTVIPGVDPTKMRQYELKCGVKFMPNVTDAIRDKEQLKALQKSRDYAAKYNSVIIERCIP